MARIGVYVCHCGSNIAGVVDVEKVVEFAKTLPDVAIAKHYAYMCSEQGQQIVQDDIKDYKLDRIVIATCSPRMHEETFRRTVEEAGLNPYLIEIVNLREQVSWAHTHEPEKATKKAEALVRMGVARAKLLEPLEKHKIRVEKGVLVVGGGIAGIQASIDLANAGFRVYLVEKSSSIGGKMAQLDKTFPTMDCSMCILAPKMLDCAHHPNVQLLTCSEVKEVKGSVGNFKVTVLKKPRYVDEKKCTGCMICSDNCPAEAQSEFDECIGVRKAIYVPFMQAVPRVPVIDMESCVECGLCEKVCPTHAVNRAQKPEEIELNVGAIVVSTGFDVFDPSAIPQYGYKRFKNVITSMELERLVCASGPTGGHLTRLSDGKIPRSIAFIQCVGSRDKRFHEYCCRVGCMVTLKQAILAREKIPGDLKIYTCFIDLRAFGKGYEEFYGRARDMDIDFVAGLPSEIHCAADGSLYFDVYDRGINKLLEVHADMVVLATGLVPSGDLWKISALLHASRSADGFLLEAHPKLRPLESAVAGVFLAGVCQGPKDIPDTVAQASGAAAKVIDLLSSGEIDIEPLKAVVDKDLCSGCRICESICPFVAIEMKPEFVKGEEKLMAEVAEAVCQGCGLCSSACPTGAVKIQQYGNKQVVTQVQAALAKTCSDGGG
ncbi:MAG TPA: CoB--CoM heterodisulfide reductase iron-sulfur subunit A family protein [Candidatus Acidoferrales bacterium]|nr:CoB--CoM heterodisulfide reductase iron-sulfur subunit A family protein [Candidatus Acidoferrales bacterium]